MSRLLVFFFALLVPFQFAWSAASAYCQHEVGEQQGRHVGHHVHTHQGETKKGTASPLAADADCASCHAPGVAVIAAQADALTFASAASAAPAPARLAYTSALIRAPDRPQWPRLV